MSDQQDDSGSEQQLRALEALRDVNRAARPYRLPHTPRERYLRSLSEAARKFHMDSGRAYLQAVTNDDGTVQSRRRVAAATRDKQDALKQRLAHGWEYESLVADRLCVESPHHRERIAGRLGTLPPELARPFRGLRPATDDGRARGATPHTG